MDLAKLKSLQELAIFGGLNTAVLQTIVTQSTTVIRSPGEFYFQEDEFADCMYVLLVGQVEVVKTFQGCDYSLVKLHEGDSFGEMAIMDFQTRCAAVRAIVKSTTICISTTCFNVVRQQDLAQFTMLQMNLGRQMCRRLRTMDEYLFQEKIKRGTLGSESKTIKE